MLGICLSIGGPLSLLFRPCSFWLIPKCPRCMCFTWAVIMQCQLAECASPKCTQQISGFQLWQDYSQFCHCSIVAILHWQILKAISTVANSFETNGNGKISKLYDGRLALREYDDVRSWDMLVLHSLASLIMTIWLSEVIVRVFITVCFAENSVLKTLQLAGSTYFQKKKNRFVKQSAFKIKSSDRQTIEELRKPLIIFNGNLSGMQFFFLIWKTL